ncbi:TPA: hypothetical protein MEY91_004063 [Klebsiella pneumoniae]|nr:hypothetical protein [Klebsiella pneumoniae]
MHGERISICGLSCVSICTCCLLSLQRSHTSARRWSSNSNPVDLDVVCAVLIFQEVKTEAANSFRRTPVNVVNRQRCNAIRVIFRLVDSQ